MNFKHHNISAVKSNLSKSCINFTGDYIIFGIVLLAAGFDLNVSDDI